MVLDTKTKLLLSSTWDPQGRGGKGLWDAARTGQPLLGDRLEDGGRVCTGSAKWDFKYILHTGITHGHTAKKAV